MRRLALILLVTLAALPAAALAARSTSGDGVFELRSANGVFILTGKGVLWGQVDKGVMRVTDLSNGVGPQLAVSGAEKTRATDDPNQTLYIGNNIHFRATGGKYKIRFKGSGIDLTAIGVGSADLSGNPFVIDAGDYAVDSGKWAPVPLLEKIVPFGTQPPVPSSTGP